MKPPRKRSRILLAGLALFILGFSFLGGYLLYWNYWGWKAPAIETTLEWPRMNPIPRQANHVQITTRGSMFSREFELSFILPPEPRSAWLGQSPGTQDAQPTTDGDWDCYPIHPGGGAQFAEVRVNRTSGQVRIRTYWS